MISAEEARIEEKKWEELSKYIDTHWVSDINNRITSALKLGEKSVMIPLYQEDTMAKIVQLLLFKGFNVECSRKSEINEPGQFIIIFNWNISE